jgi:glycerol-3-phosphate dehydrogenase
LDVSKTIRSFAAIRPNPYRVVQKDGKYVHDGGSIHGFAIENPGPGFYSLIGIKTPGLSCAEELGLYLAGQAARYLDAQVNQSFDPRRKAIPNLRSMRFEEQSVLTERDSDYADVVCLCEGITRGEIKEAVRRGAVNADGVKRRIGSGMGSCQGSRCRMVIEEILEGMRNGKL